MELFRSKRLSQTGRYLDTIPPCRYLVEFALRARNITTLGALATQFHEKCGLARIFHEARCARREKWPNTGHPWPVFLSPTICVGPKVPTQTVGSKFRRYASEFASASMHLLARTSHVRAILGLGCHGGRVPRPPTTARRALDIVQRLPVADEICWANSRI
jgi:hypothetical protein